MEIDFKEFLIICAILIVISGASYSLFIFDNQKQVIKIQGHLIKNQNIDIEEKEGMLEREKLLDEDKDGDGLTLREELNLRTSDLSVDSDDDGVPDKFDEHPLGGGRMIVKYLEWHYSNKHWTLELSIPADAIIYYEQIPRPKWQGNYSIYFSEFIDINDKGVEQLTKILEDSIYKHEEDYNWDYYDKIMFVVSMVQQLHYTSDILVGFDQFTKFPMQTLNDGTGDCEDMAILAAAILKKMDYDVKLLFLDVPHGENHVAIAIFGEDTYPGFYFEKNNKKYFYVETISTGYDFGEFPPRWIGSIAILIDIN